MTAGAALIAVESPAIDQAVLVASAARPADPIGPAGFLKGSLTLLRCAVELLELGQRKTFWK
jgi:hypothetical protein